MMVRTYGITLAVMFFFQFVFGAKGDSLWAYTDQFGTPGYSGVEIADTSSIKAPFPNEIHENGYSYDSTIVAYFSFDYTFTDGWAGFKLMWEERDYTWDVRDFDSLMVKYMGPLSYHHVDIFFGEAIDRYGAATIDSVGTINACSTWVTVTIPIPQISDPSMRENVREVRFIIHNNPGRTDPTSSKGNFSFDAVGFKKKNTAGIIALHGLRSLNARHGFFTPSLKGKVMLSAYSLSGKLLLRTSAAVMPGQSYSIRRFAQLYGNASASQARLIRIVGAGVNLQQEIAW